MTIAYVDAVTQKADQRAMGRLARLVVWFAGLAVQCIASALACGGAMTLDDMNEEQLTDIGVKRIGRHDDAWHDYREAPRASGLALPKNVLQSGNTGDCRA